MYCRAPLHACMGHVHAGDFMRLLDGEDIKPREICAVCIFKHYGIESYEPTKGED